MVTNMEFGSTNTVRVRSEQGPAAPHARPLPPYTDPPPSSDKISPRSAVISFMADPNGLSLSSPPQTPSLDHSAAVHAKPHPPPPSHYSLRLCTLLSLHCTIGEDFAGA
jgi:hypothetical protein